MMSFAKGFGILFAVVVTAVSLQNLTRQSVKPSDTVSDGISLKNDLKNDNERPINDGPMMLELYTPYCPSCSQMAPLVETLAENCATEGVSVITYDISAVENEHMVDELNIEAVPTFLFFDESGKEAGRLVGKQSAEALQSKLSGIGGRACDGRS